MIRKFVWAFASVISLAGIGSASAADMAVRPAPPPLPYVAPIYNWTGFYIGINGGWGQSSTSYDWANFFARSDNASGGTVGGQIGYNWQAGAWVFGLEAQGNWADFSRSYIDPFNPAWSVGSSVDALGLFTGRVGYAANNVLFYVKGGAAVANNSYWAALNNVNFINASNTRWGASVGAGLEYGFTPNWSFGVEYNHLFLGDTTYNWTNPTWRYTNVNIGQDIDLVTARVNYRFGGPLVPRY